MKARIPKHREFIINFPDSVDQAKANEGWAKLQQIVHLHQTHAAAVFLIRRSKVLGSRDDRLRLLAGDERDARRRHGITRCK